MTDIYKHKPIVTISIIVLAFSLYMSGIKAPWYFDDYINIVENPLTNNLGLAFSNIYKQRGVSYFSFAINYALAGMDPIWFRLTNIALHAGTALLAWRILVRLYGESLVALAGALFFLVHPLQTQAVTYIVQRMAGMATFFCLLSVYVYIKARESMAERKNGSLYWYSGAVLFAALSIWTKQNTIFIPFIIMAVDYAIIDKENFSVKKSLWRIVPFFVISAIAVCQQFYDNSNFIVEMSDKAQTYTDILSSKLSSQNVVQPAHAGSAFNAMPMRYFSTELIVYWLYIKLFFFPVGQMVDYSWPVVEHVFNLKSILALSGFALLIALVHHFRLWSRRLIFGLAWVVLALALESSFIPLDPVFEHRLYLPFLGGIVIINELFFARMPSRLQMTMVVTALVVFSSMTVMRNALWASPIGLWHDNAQKAPNSARVYSNLAKAYYDQGDVQNAERYFESALQLDPEQATACSGLGVLYFHSNRRAAGLPLLEKAVRLAPKNELYLRNLAVAYDLSGRREEAEALYRKVLAINPRNAKILLGLGVLLDETGRSVQGLTILRDALQQAPDDAKTIYYYGVAAFHARDETAFRSALDSLQRLDRNYYAKLAERTRDGAK